MNVLLTGGNGFIGYKLLSALKATGHTVRVVTRSGIAAHAMGDDVQVVRLDLTDPAISTDDLVSGCSVVFNCAGSITEQSSMYKLHVTATARLVESCKKQARSSGVNIHWVQLSSVGAYGGAPPGTERIVTEETTPNPSGDYEVTKTQADDIVLAANEPGVFSYSILRPSNVYGAGMPNNSLRQWGQLVRKRLFFYVGRRGAVSTYVHVDDVVSALMLCGFDERAKGEIFNISNDCPQEQFVEAMASALKVPAPHIRVPMAPLRLLAKFLSRVPGFPVSTSRIDSLVARTRYPTEKLESRLGFSPQHAVKDTIGEIFLDGEIY